MELHEDKNSPSLLQTNPSLEAELGYNNGIEKKCTDANCASMSDAEQEVDAIAESSDMRTQNNATNNSVGNICHLPVFRSTLSLSKTVTEIINGDADEETHIKTVAWIIIIGDSLHNFIDGVSIGTAFVKSFHTGAVISLAIICEEFPHELGDFAILINSGMSVKKALFFNFLSATTCYFGVMLGILLGEISWDSYIFAFAAGIFLYVAFGDMVRLYILKKMSKMGNLSLSGFGFINLLLLFFKDS